MITIQRKHRKTITILIGLLFFIMQNSFAQIEHPITWRYAAKRTGKNKGVLFLKATITPGWHVYSAFQKDGGPVKTSFVFERSPNYILSGGMVEPKPLTRFEKSFGMDVEFFECEVVFRQKLVLRSPKAIVKGKLTYMVCNDHKCLPPEDVDFKILINNN